MAVHIPVKADGAVFIMTEDVDWICGHDDAYIEKACCSTRGTSGMIECGCGGQDSVVCPSERCTGIDDSQVDALFSKLTGGE